MRYQITIRPITASDASSENPFAEYDEDEYQMHKNSLINDMKSIKEIASIKANEGEIFFNSNLDEKAIKKFLRPYFSHVFKYVRYEKMEVIKDGTAK